MAAFIASRGVVSASNTLTLSNPEDIAVGSVLVLGGYNGSSQNLTGLTDSRGNVWTLHHQVAHPANGIRSYIASCRVDTPYQAGDSISWGTLSHANRIFEVLELGPVDPIDYYDTSVQVATANNAGVANSGPITTAGPSIIVGVVGWGSSLGVSLGSADGFTLIGIRQNGTGKLLMGYRISLAEETISFTYDHGGSSGYNAVVGQAAFHVPPDRPPGAQAVVIA